MKFEIPIVKTKEEKEKLLKLMYNNEHTKGIKENNKFNNLKKQTNENNNRQNTKHKN
tara:strand:+ start:269 stop:439 length:171 start_codon:yes stop_codon:yes gene_type:complete